MSDEIQVRATFHKKRVGKHIAMVEGPSPTVSRTSQRPLASHYSLHGTRDLLRRSHPPRPRPRLCRDRRIRPRHACQGNPNHELATAGSRYPAACLELPRVVVGRDYFSLRELQTIALQPSGKNNGDCLAKSMVGAIVNPTGKHPRRPSEHFSEIWAKK